MEESYNSLLFPTSSLHFDLAPLAPISADVESLDWLSGLEPVPEVPALEGFSLYGLALTKEVSSLSLPAVNLSPKNRGDKLCHDLSKNDAENESRARADGNDNLSNEEEEDQPWTNWTSLSPLANDVKYLTWERFQSPNNDAAEHIVPFASEAGAGVYDAILQLHDQSSAGRLVKTDVFLRSLWLLSLGRASKLFEFNEETKSFRSVVQNARPSGFSLALVQSWVHELIQTGNMLHQLRQFRDGTHKGIEVALASAVSVVLDTLEAHSVARAASVLSLLQLKSQVDSIKPILLAVFDLVEQLTAEQMEARKLDIAFTKAQQAEEAGDIVQHQVLRGIFTRLVQPWIDQLFALEVDDEQEQDAETQLPTFVSSEISKLIREARQCRRYITTYHPDHTLAQKYLQVFKAEWCWTREDAERVRQTHDSHHPSTITRIDQDQEEELHGWLNIDNPDGLSNSIDVLNHLPSNTSSEQPSDLHALVSRNLVPTIFQRHDVDEALQLPIRLTADLTLHPYLETQHAILANFTLRSILTQQDLRRHLHLLYNFFLCRSGIFTSRLSTILFAPEVQSAQRQRGTVRTSSTLGLRLGSADRKEWPPASSELRLALMGLLSDTSAIVSGTPRTGREEDEISFAIRTSLAEEEVEKILDRDSIYALDFLRLSYSPPGPLAEIMNEKVLEKYDRVFKLMLRMLRMQFVVGQLFHSAKHPNSSSTSHESSVHVIQRYRNEATTFVTAITSYFTQYGIEVAWTRFTRHIIGVEASMCRQQSGAYSLADLIDEHEMTMKRICTALLLRREQEEARVTLESVCGDILRFARILLSDDLETGTVRSLKEEYINFRKNVTAFMHACVALRVRGAGHVKYDTTGSIGANEGQNNDGNIVDALGHFLYLLDE